MSDNSESFEEWFDSFKTDGEHESMESFEYKLFDLFALKNSCEHTWNARGEIEQKKIDELKRNQSKLIKNYEIEICERRELQEKLQAAKEEIKMLREALETRKEQGIPT